MIHIYIAAKTEYHEIVCVWLLKMTTHNCWKKQLIGEIDVKSIAILRD